MRAACARDLADAVSRGRPYVALPARGIGPGGLTPVAAGKILVQEAIRVAREGRSGLREIRLSYPSAEGYEAFEKTATGYVRHFLDALIWGPFVTVDVIIEMGGTNAPAAPGRNAPAAPGGNAPAAPGRNAPAAPGGNAPAAPGGNAPAAPGGNAPAAPGIVLIERSNPPFGLALPGGFVDYGESLEQAVTREALEETGLELLELRQFHTYSDPSRDPRFHTVTTVFVARAEGLPKAGDDAAAARVVPVERDRRPVVRLRSRGGPEGLPRSRQQP